MTELNTIFNEFRNPALNELAGTLITRNKEVLEKVREARKYLSSALTRRYLNGRDIDYHYPAIMEECQTQREFAQRIGLSESVISNDLRAFKALKKHGIETPQEFKKHMNKIGVSLTVRNWEKLPDLLANPNSVKEDQRPQPEKDLERAVDKIQRVANESPHSDIQAEAKIAIEQAQDLQKHLNQYNPYKYQWDVPAYRKWCRDIGMCMITKKACTTEFHHTDPKGGSGGTGDKLPDVFGFPVDIDLHRRIENESEVLTESQISNAIIETLSLFVMTHYE